MLPAPELIGREAELARVLDAFAEKARVVTLWGPGGIGKTSLALSIAHANETDVAFAVVREDASPEDVVRALTAALGAHAGRSRTVADGLQRVGELLAARKKLLVVVDNAESAVDIVAQFLVRLRSLAPHARFLVTSREPLGIGGEKIVEVPPLSNEMATRLLEDRAKAARSDLRASPEQLRALVAKTEGIPLAIELCAARLDVLTVDDLLGRLEVSIDVLATRRRDVDPRHRTLFASIDVSVRLLDERERRALIQLMAFPRDFSVGDAETVISVSTAPLDVLSALVAKCLVVRRGQRFGLYETVRAFLAATASGDEGALQRHAGHVSKLASNAVARLDGESGAHAIVELARLEHDLVAVARRLQTPAAVDAVVALGELAKLRGPVASFVELAKNVSVVHTDDVALGRIRTALGEAYLLLGELELAHATLEDAAARRTGTFDRHRTTLRLAEVAIERGAYEAASEWLAHVPDGTDRCLLAGQLAHRRGDLDEARSSYESALRYADDMRNVRGRARGVTRLGFLAYDEGRFVEAKARFLDALTMFAEIGDDRSRGVTVGYLGNVARAEAAYDEAIAHYDDAISVLRRAGDRLYEAVFQMDLGITYLLTRRAARALEELARTRSVDAPQNSLLVGLVTGYRMVALAALGRVNEARELEASSRAAATGIVLACLNAHARTIAARDPKRREELSAWLDANDRGAAQTEHIRLSRALLRTALRESTPAQAVLVEGDRIYVRDRGWVDLSARPVLLRVARFLIEQRTSHPGTAYPVASILAAGWPGENVRPDAGAIRVRVALAHLRKVALGRSLVRSRDGWYLDPN